MPARFTQGVIRPACLNPQHADGRTSRAAALVVCAACDPTRPGPAWTRHRFIEPLRRRHDSAEPGKRCETCDREAGYHEGPQTANGFTFTIGEAARALLSVGEGLTYRTTSYKTRRQARRSVS